MNLERLATTDVGTDVRNRITETRELEKWANIPWAWGFYYKLASSHDREPKPPFSTHGTVTTWLGTPVGVITEARVYRHNLGGRFVSIRVKATNGGTYYGRASYDNGSYVTLRLSKGAR